MKKKKKEKNFWQRFKTLIIRPKFTHHFFARLFAGEKKIKIELDKRDIKRISQTLSQELAKVISEPKFWLGKLVTELKNELTEESPRVSKVRRFIEPKKIKIKESFINPMEDEVKLKSSFSKKPEKRRTSGANVEKSLEVLKKISN